MPGSYNVRCLADLCPFTCHVCVLRTWACTGVAPSHKGKKRATRSDQKTVCIAHLHRLMKDSRIPSPPPIECMYLPYDRYGGRDAMRCDAMPRQAMSCCVMLCRGAQPHRLNSRSKRYTYIHACAMQTASAASCAWKWTGKVDRVNKP